MAKFSTSEPRQWRFLPVILAAGLALAIIGVDLARTGLSPELTREGGGIETATAVLYIFCAMTFIRMAGPVIARRNWEIPLLFLFMAGRELDFDKRFTTLGIFKSRLYLSDTAPVYERLIGVAVLALLAYALYRLIRHHGADFVDGLRRFAPSQWAVACGIAVMAGSKTIDGLGRKLMPLGIELEDATNAELGMIEEVVELAIPLLFIAAMCLAVRMFRAGHPE